MEHIRFIKKPNLAMYPGIVVDKTTVLEFSTDKVTQKLENLVFHSVTRVQGEGYEGSYDTTIVLKEGDILIYNGEEEGYVKPVESFVRIGNAIQEMTYIQDLG